MNLMAAISWSVIGMTISEADRLAAQAGVDLAAQNLQQWTPPQPTPIVEDHSLTNTNLSGQLNKVPLTYVSPYGWIPSGTVDLVDAFQQGYRYLSGQWIKTGVAQPTTSIALPTGTYVPTGSTIEQQSAGNLPGSATSIPFVGGPMESIRLTTGLGADTGALAPVRMGMGGTFMPRIIMSDVAT